MIEVEKKFILTKEDESKLINNAVFIGKKEFTDIYYDNKDYYLTKQDIWLRKRENRYELKIPLNVSIQDRISDQYQELETEEEIIEYLKLNKNIDLANALLEKGYVPFCEIITKREKYKHGEYGIDIDSMDFGYQITEIELMIGNISEIEKATQQIITFAKSLGLSTEKQIRGKVVEYLYRKNPEHFQTLIDAEVIK